MLHNLFASLLFSACLCLAEAPSSTGYVLGSGDELVVRVLDTPEIDDRPIRVDSNGNISLPLAGDIHVTGLTAEGVRAQLTGRLRAFLNSPSVTVRVVGFRNQPVSVLGAVNQPGVHQINGPKTLIEVLSQAGGLRNDAGNAVKVTRRKEMGSLPLPNAVLDSSGQFYVAELRSHSLIEAKNPQENIIILPHDVVSVPRAECIYVIGAVRRSGGFVLNEREELTVLQALALAEGLDRLAAPKLARILRPTAGGHRNEIPVNINRILANKMDDVSLRANDTLFIPNSAARGATMRALEAALQMGTGLVIWRR
ncbi:MAG TPA: polysaccharide biosynthesis/export family protein [Bryobacteraceae bacterium]|nr:polysaccharide biosynthesis/export family protein [Bryobacteraceae bacterium]